MPLHVQSLLETRDSCSNLCAAHRTVRRSSGDHGELALSPTAHATLDHPRSCRVAAADSTEAEDRLG